MHHHGVDLNGPSTSWSTVHTRTDTHTEKEGEILIPIRCHTISDHIMSLFSVTCKLINPILSLPACDHLTHLSGHVQKWHHLASRPMTAARRFYFARFVLRTSDCSLRSTHYIITSCWWPKTSIHLDNSRYIHTYIHTTKRSNSRQIKSINYYAMKYPKDSSHRSTTRNATHAAVVRT